MADTEDGSQSRALGPNTLRADRRQPVSAAARRNRARRVSPAHLRPYAGHARTINTAFVPPNANELDSTVRRPGAGRAALAT